MRTANFTNDMFLGSLQSFLMIFVLTFFSVFSVKAQMNFAELNQSMQEERKPMVIYVSSKYCLYCLMQEKKVKNDKVLLQRLNQDYYFAKLLAEKDKEVVFNNERYVNQDPKDNYSINDFATIYGENEGVVGFPLWLFFDSNYQLNFRYSGLLTPKDLVKILDTLESKKPISTNKLGAYRP